MNEQKPAFSTAMIVSVGGTPAPIIESIRHFRPEFVSFFASQETLDKVMEIKSEAKTSGLSLHSETTLVDNINDLLHCHGKAEEAVGRVLAKGYDGDNVIVDYTGGTKNMSVALSLAAIVHGFSFSYVGGSHRTKNGIGPVVDGSELVFKNINPWDFLALEERRKISLLFNRHQFKAAGQLCANLAKKNVNRRSLYKKIGFMIVGYHEWDLFRYKAAQDRFKRAKIEELLEEDCQGVRSFAESTLALHPFLEIAAKTGNKPCLSYILDLLANARRRFHEGKTDDAVIRLYRIVEMAGQQRLLDRFGINASDVPVEKLPHKLRDPYEKRYRGSRNGSIKLPMEAGYNVLKELGDDLGKKFYEERDNFLNIQQSRNFSFLAHGFQSAKEDTYESLQTFILSLNFFKKEEAPQFPKLEL